MPVEAWLFVAACGVICALLVGFGIDLVQRAAAPDKDDAEQGDASR